MVINVRLNHQDRGQSCPPGVLKGITAALGIVLVCGVVVVSSTTL